jgi:hypothetical protein
MKMDDRKIDRNREGCNEFILGISHLYSFKKKADFIALTLSIGLYQVLFGGKMGRQD